MEKIFGDLDIQLMAPEGTKKVSELVGTKVVGLYFSAHWCPPCRGFTPKLAEAYLAITADKDKSFEIVFVSSDRDEAQFKSYCKEMPWLAVPFARRDIKKDLSKQYKVSGIPALILLDGDTGAVISKDGRSVIMADSVGANFPWAPKSLPELLGDIVLSREGAELSRSSATDGKHLALYFSANWCPPCKRFTPELAKTYAAIKAARSDFELIFVSGDRDVESFKAYFKEMPWLALPFDSERYNALSSHFEVEGIPALVVLDPEGKVITTKGRSAAGADPEGQEFPWHPKPVTSVEEAAGDLNETPAVIVLCEKASPQDKCAITAALTAVAQERLAAAASGAPMDLVFATAASPGSVSEQVRRLCNLSDDDRGTKMVLLDIPDDGAYYVWTPKDGDTALSNMLSEASVRDFIADYKAKSLLRHQLAEN